MVHTIYLVDDDPEFLASFGDFLTAHGFRVVLFQGGEQLLRHQSPDRPSIIVSDYALQGMAGDELLKRVSRDARWRGVPMVVVTGSRDSSLPVRLDAPVVYKPNVDAMIGAIRVALDSAPEE